MSTLILGGTGFIGSRVARKLVERGEPVVCLDLIPEAPAVADLRDRVNPLRGDVTRIEEVLSALKAHRVRRVIHLAYVLNSESDQGAHPAVRVNALGTSNVFEAARLMEVERVVYSSSISVYGPQSLYGDRPITEGDLPAPVTLYGAAKLLNDYEAAICRSRFGQSLVGLRVGVVSGHGRLRGEGMWAATFASNPAVGKPAEIPFPPELRVSLIHVDDVAELFARVALAPAPRQAIYNTGGDDVAVGDLAALVQELIPGARHTFGAVPGSLPYALDASRAESEFGWQREPLAARLRQHIGDAQHDPPPR